MSWSDDDTETVTKLWNDGLTASQIASKLTGKYTRNAVIGKVHRLGLVMRGPSTQGRRGEITIRQGKGVRHRTTTVSHLEAAVFGKAIGGGKGATGTRWMAEPLPPEDTPPANLIALLDLEPHQCRWIYGDPKTSESGCCGKQQIIGLPYCIDHSRRAYRPVEIKGNLHLLDINEARKVKARREFA
jgi:GcrA cell cycle regulator